MTKKPENKKGSCVWWWCMILFGCRVTISVLKRGLETNEPMALWGWAAIWTSKAWFKTDGLLPPLCFKGSST